jgi:hypothetical protein
MSCTLATLKLCLSLSGIYVDSGLEYHDVGEWRSQPYTQTVLAQSYSEGGQTDSHPSAIHHLSQHKFPTESVRANWRGISGRYRDRSLQADPKRRMVA